MVGNVGWRIISGGAAIVAGMAARAVVSRAWDAAGPTSSPVNPADRRLSWRVALTWALAAGVAAGVARVVGRRAAAAGWEQATGSAPPGVETA